MNMFFVCLFVLGGLWVGWDFGRNGKLGFELDVPFATI
jgi:hypothetical protein